LTSELTATPDWEDVRQYEGYEQTVVPVKHEGAINARNLPAKRSVMRQINIPYWGDAVNPVPIELVPADPRIKNVWLQSWGSNPGVIFLGTAEQLVRNNSVNSTDAFRYDGSAIFGPLQGFQEPLCAFASVAGQNIVSVRIEYWAD